MAILTTTAVIDRQDSDEDLADWLCPGGHVLHVDHMPDNGLGFRLKSYETLARVTYAETLEDVAAHVGVTLYAA